MQLPAKSAVVVRTIKKSMVARPPISLWSVVSVAMLVAGPIIRKTSAAPEGTPD